MPRIPRRRKQVWEEPPAAEQTDAAALPQAGSADQPTTQFSTGDPLAAPAPEGGDAPAAGDGTVQTDPLAAAQSDTQEGAASGAPAADASATGGDPLTGTGAPTTPGGSGGATSGDPLAGAGAGGDRPTDRPTDQPTAAMPILPADAPGPVQKIEGGEEPTVVQPSPTPVVEGATGAAVAGEVAPPAAGSAPTPEAEAEAEAAEQAPEDARPGFRDRTRMRRRLRYLRRLRELAFRDLGGLVFDLHRFGRERPDLVAGKLHALAAIDHELRTLETALRERTDFTDVREAGIAACPRCGTLHDTDANFCPGCGTSLRSAIVRDASPVTVIPAAEAGAEPATPATSGSGTPTAATPDTPSTSETTTP